MRIDSHHHLWTRSITPQPWIDASQSSIARDFEVDDLVAAVGNRADRTVLVQTACSVAETERFLATAGATPLIGAVIGWADLTAPDLDETLHQLRSSHHGSWLRGVRHQVQSEADPRWLERLDVQAGLAVLAEHELVYELLTLPHQLPAAIAVVERLPQVRFVLNHLSKPPIAAGDQHALSNWASHLRQLALFPNVSAKISGLVTEADWQRWTLDDIEPVVDIALEAFGPNRLLVGSDWPVCLLAGTYEEIDDLHTKLLIGLSRSEQDLILGGNAASLYRIDASRAAIVSP